MKGIVKFDPAAYWEARLAKNFDLQGAGYGGLGRFYNSWLYKIRGAVFDKEIRRLQIDLAHSRILDIGSGTGFYIDRWRRLGATTVTGCDLTTIAVSRLRQQFRNFVFCQVDVGEGQLSPLEGQSFDAISAFDVLFHIIDDQRFRTAIRNISTWLALGGYFLFSDNFLRHEEVRVAHQVCRRLETFEEVLTQNGLEVVSRTPMFVLMNQPLDTTSKAARWLWKLLTYPAKKSEIAGYCLGATLFPFELLATRWLRESPTTEIMVCRKAW